MANQERGIRSKIQKPKTFSNIGKSKGNKLLGSEKKQQQNSQRRIITKKKKKKFNIDPRTIRNLLLTCADMNTTHPASKVRKEVKNTIK